MPSEEIDHVMNPFYRVDGMLARSHESSGLGLALVKSMFDMHNAKINISSECNKGTTVRIEFPVQRSVPAIKMPNKSRSL